MAAGCAGDPGPPAQARVVTASSPSQAEDYCAWYGDARDGVLYFGQAAFWSAMRAHDGDPLGDLATPGPQRIGRFDLRRERMLPALDVTAAGARSGVWDVYAHPNGRVYFTTFYEAMGAVDPETGAVQRFPALGLGLNEIAPGPGDSLLVTRYAPNGPGPPGQGSLLVVSPEGTRIAEHALPAQAGYLAAPKTPALDTATGDYWITADLLPERADGTPRNEAFVLGPDGTPRRRIETPEIQFVADRRGTGLFRAERVGSRLELVRPGGPVVLDANFAVGFDFAQDVKPGADAGAVVTQWSGQIHRVTANGAVRTRQFPKLEADGLYYTGVRTGDRVCATYCAGIRVVCATVR
ncbi:MAG: hypothetical protein VX546_14205 [Myxococcota bacterium]|nr:hypothetical protein [Myxococcota bacterium]